MAGNKTDVTTVFKADISQFSDSVESLKRYIQQVNSEFKVATKGASDWGKSQDGLKAKLSELNRILPAQEQVLVKLQQQYDKVSKEQGENSKEAQKLTTEINKFTAAIDKTKSDIEKYNKSLDKMDGESKDGGKSLNQLEKASKDAGDGFTVAKGAIAGFISNGLTALVGAAKNAISTLGGLADSTREYRQTLATLDTAADDVGVSSDKVRDKFTELMGVFNDEGSVTEGLNNLLTAGFDEKSLDSITQSLEGASLKWKDTLKFEGLADSLQEWIGSSGENLSGNFAELLERMGYNLEEVKEKTEGMTDEQRRNYAMNLLASEGLNEVSESYRKQNADMVEAQTANVEYQNAVANMGAKIEPITTKVREGFTKIVEKMLELVDGVDLDALGATIETAFAYFIDTIIPAVVDGLKWVLDNKDAIIGGIVGIGSAFAAWKVVTTIQGIIKAFKTWKATTEGVTIAQKLLNTVMNMNPIGLIIAAVVGLVAAFIYLWKNCESFREFWKNLWEGIKKAAKVAWEAIKGCFKSAWDAIKSIWGGVKAWFAGVWNGIKSIFSSVGSFFSKAFQSAVSAIKRAFSNIGSFFSGIWKTIKGMFLKVGSAIGDAISGAFKTAINGALSGAEKIINGFIKAINGAIKFINKIPKVNIKKLSLIDIPRLAKGGVVDTATLAQIGEAGKEAVIPLENNTQGLDLIADKLSERIGGKGFTINNYNTFNRMTTTRFALHTAQRQSEAAWKLLIASMGGV